MRALRYPCLHCDRQVEQPFGRHRPRKYCSPACRRAAANLAYRAGRPRVPRVDGSWIRRARQAVELTTSELGALCGVSGATVSNWETGYHQPAPRHAERLEALFGTEVSRA